MNKDPDFLGSFAGENLFTAAGADFGGDMLDEDTAAFDGKDFTNPFETGGVIAADVAGESDHLLLLKPSHRAGSGT